MVHEMPRLSLKFSDFMEIVELLERYGEELHYEILDAEEKNETGNRLQAAALKDRLESVTAMITKIKDIPMG